MYFRRRGGPLVLTLYYSPGACSLGPHIMMEETGIACEYKPVVLANGENNTPAYKAINRRGFVPALDIDGRVTTEGPAIMQYLASLKPTSDILPPGGSFEYAKCFEWIAWCSSNLHIAYTQLWRPQRFRVEEPYKQTFVDNGRALVAEKNQEVETQLKGDWLLGERYSPADCYLLAFYRWGVRIGLPMTQSCPRWSAWKDRMIARPAVLRAIEAEGIGTQWAPI